MLVETYRRCWGEVANDADDDKKIVNNALIESFCVHARNLIEFFRNNKFTTAYAASYKPFKRFAGTDQISTIYDRLCGQISHLVHEKKGIRRTIHGSEKITAWDRYEILDILRAEIVEFRAHLATGEYAHVAAVIPVPRSAFDIPPRNDPDATTTTESFVTSGYFHHPSDFP